MPDPARPRAATLPRLLREAAAAYGEAPAYAEGERTVSFTGLLALVRAVARGYLAGGIEPGDRVVVWAPNSIDWVVAALATSYAGGVLVPANSRYTGHEVAEIVERTNARIVVVADGFLDRHQVDDLWAASDLPSVRTLLLLPDSPRRSGWSGAPDATRTSWTIGWGELVEAGEEVDEAEVEARADAVSPDDVADIMFTSGTTGRPKGAMSAHRQTIGVADAWRSVAGVSSADRYLVVNPFFHTFGYKAGIVVGLLTGACLFPLATFDLDASLDVVERERITVLPGAPAIFQAVLNAPDRAHRDLSSLRLVVTGAAVVPVVLIERMVAELGIETVLTAFGQTECVVATMCRPGDPAEVVATTCGRAVPGVETRIEPATGELLLRGDVVMLGYLDDPDATAAAIDAEGWLHTGDVGRLDEVGNLTITDRLKDMYICGGFNVYPAEVEQALARLDGVADVAVVGVPDERLGEVGTAYVVRDDASLSADDVVGFARERLANFKVPREVVFLDALPRNLSGKVLKRELRSDA